MIIGCDFHPSWQQVSWVDTETGETGERKLVQASGDAERFYRRAASTGTDRNGIYRKLPLAGGSAGGAGSRVMGGRCGARSGPVACGSRRRTGGTRSTLRILLQEGRFPRIWMPSSEVRDLRQLLLRSLQAGNDPGAGEEDEFAASVPESGSAAQAQAVEPGGTEGAARVAAEAVGGTAAGRFAGAAGHARSADRSAGPGGERRSATRQNGASFTNPAGSGSGNGAGLRC